VQAFLKLPKLVSYFRRPTNNYLENCGSSPEALPCTEY
jgi:hypothetical protein